MMMTSGYGVPYGVRPAYHPQLRASASADDDAIRFVCVLLSRTACQAASTCSVRGLCLVLRHRRRECVARVRWRDGALHATVQRRAAWSSRRRPERRRRPPTPASRCRRCPARVTMAWCCLPLLARATATAAVAAAAAAAVSGVAIGACCGLMPGALAAVRTVV
jgi:hypothetical protein